MAYGRAPHSPTRFPLLVSIPVRYGHHRRASPAIVPFQAQTQIHTRSKSDALFSYQPPFNLVAFLVLWPLSCVVSPRKLHSVNVFMIKLTVSVPVHFPFYHSRLTPPRSFNVQFNTDRTPAFHRNCRKLEIVFPNPRGDWPL